MLNNVNLSLVPLVPLTALHIKPCVYDARNWSETSGYQS